MAGAENAWKTPILQSEEVQYLNMQANNLDMEYSRWLEYLIKIICAVYLIAPEEIGFYLSPGGMQQPAFESNNEWKLKASKDRGLRPLLRFYADAINKNVIDQIDDTFYLDFVGLDELTEKERIELRNQQVQYFRTVNEIRADEDMSPIEDGDIILNPIYLQKIQMDHMRETEEIQRKEAKEAQEEQLNMQKQQMAMQQEAQQQQVGMQQQQLNGAQEAPAEEPTTVPSPEEQMAAQAQEAPPEEQMAAQDQEAPPEGAPMAPPEGEEVAAEGEVAEEGAPGGEEMAAQEEVVEEGALEERPQSKKEQLQAILNSLPPEMLSNNRKGVGEE